MAPDKFKGSLTASEAARAIAEGLRSAWPDAAIALVPMADGGDGTVDAFVDAGWTRVERRVRGPLGAPVDAAFAWRDEAGGVPTAAIEMATASGLALVPAGRADPLRATSFGTGELVAAALDRGARRIVVALGGSATNDAGAGMLAALGARFLDASGRELAPGGAALAQLARIEIGGLDRRLRDVTFDVAADVDAPLLGGRGASAVFGPQKGASPDAVATLDAALARFADHAATVLDRDVRDEPGTGAAGGLGFALRAFFGAPPRSGVGVVADLRGLPAALAGAAYCFTGEGSIDAQTLAGKTVAGVALMARDAGAKTIAFGGRVDADAERALAERDVVCVPIVDGPLAERDALARAGELLERAAARVARAIA